MTRLTNLRVSGAVGAVKDPVHHPEGYEPGNFGGWVPSQVEGIGGGSGDLHEVLRFQSVWIFLLQNCL